MESLVHLLHFIEEIMELSIDYIAVILECIGIFLLTTNTFKNIFKYFSGKKEITMDLAKGYSMALEIMLGGEILHTITTKEVSQLLILGGIIAARVAITLLLHWEIKEEVEEEEKHHAHSAE